MYRIIKFSTRSAAEKFISAHQARGIKGIKVSGPTKDGDKWVVKLYDVTRG